MAPKSAAVQQPNEPIIHSEPERPHTEVSSSTTESVLPAPASRPNVPKRSDPNPLPSTGTYSGRDYTKEEVKDLIIWYSKEYGIDPALPLRIAFCESGYNARAKNKSSTASGTYQYLAGTWKNTPEGRDGLSVFDADANVRAAVRHMALKGTSPWNASKHCWS